MVDKGQKTFFGKVMTSFLILLILQTMLFCTNAYAKNSGSKNNSKGITGKTSGVIDGIVFSGKYAYGWNVKADSIYIKKIDNFGNPVGDWKSVLKINNESDGIFKKKIIRSVAAWSDYIYIFLGATDAEGKGEILYAQINKDGSIGQLKKASFIPKRILSLDNVEVFSLYGRLYFLRQDDTKPLLGGSSPQFYITTPDENGDLQEWKSIPAPTLYPVTVIYANGYFFGIGGKEGNEVEFSKIMSVGFSNRWQSTLSVPSSLDFFKKDSNPLTINKHMVAAREGKLLVKGRENGKERVLAGKIEPDGNILEWKEVSPGIFKLTPSMLMSAEEAGVTEAKPAKTNLLKSDSYLEQVALDINIPNTLYAYDRAHKKLLKSTDMGQSWSASILDGINLANFIQVQGEKNTFLALTSETVLKTTDGGKKWVESREGLPKFRINHNAYHSYWETTAFYRRTAQLRPENIAAYKRIAQSKTDPKIFYITIGDSVYKSMDAGLHWIKKNNGLAMETEDEASVFAGASPLVAYVLAVTRNCGQPGSYKLGVLITEDGGNSWKVQECLKETATSVMLIGKESAYFFKNIPEYRMYPFDEKMEISKYRNGSIEEYHPKSMIFSIKNYLDRENNFEIYSAAFNPNDINDMYIASSKGIYRTRDGGSNWDKVSGIHAEEILISPTEPNRILIVVEGKLKWVDLSGKSLSTGRGDANSEQSEKGNPEIGRQLFAGEKRFANKTWLPCGNCHKFGDHGTSWVGPELTNIVSDPSKKSMLNATYLNDPNGHGKSTAYDKYKITEEEANHLKAFLLGGSKK